MGKDDDDETSVVDRFFYCFRGVSSILGAILLFFVLMYFMLYQAMKSMAVTKT